LRAGKTASQALGYVQVLRLLGGVLTEQQAIDETKRATRRFARRQDTWFRRDPRVTWVPHDAADLMDVVLQTMERSTARKSAHDHGPKRA
jgi:tRNA dimethylallyltransferase